MAVHSDSISLSTKGDGHTQDVTHQVREAIARSGLTAGTVTIFVPGSTGGVTTIEFEPGVVEDLRDCFSRLAPKDLPYFHEEAWHDGNGHSHVRAALLGPSLTVPFNEGNLVLGTWQQIVVVDFDNKARRRTIHLQIMGE